MIFKYFYLGIVQQKVFSVKINKLLVAREKFFHALDFYIFYQKFACEKSFTIAGYAEIKE